jgi:hypothetical protein
MSVATATTEVRTPTTRARKPQVRTLRIVRGNPPYSGQVMISIDAASTLYAVEHTQLAPAFGPGLAFLFKKLYPDGSAAGEGYHVTCSTADPEAPVIDCDCLGHRHYGRCRHADCLSALLKHAQQ